MTAARRKTRRSALVTGASAGIGRAFADRLARDGWDVTLVARRGSRLRSLARQLHEKQRARIGVVVADLTKNEDLAAVEERIARDRRLELLVNNAGMGEFGGFHERDRAAHDAEIRLNVLAVVRLTHAALRGMIQRGRGAVINVSSLAAFQPCPFVATYGATKAFLNSFTEALREETRGTGVQVQALCPGGTQTEIFERAGVDVSALPSFVWMEPEAVVEESLAALQQGSGICVPGFGNRALSSLTGMLPTEVLLRVGGALGRRIRHLPSDQ
jgi:short-subunit dehydrogenase